MRTKLFLAFLAVIVTAFISSVIFSRLVRRDFDDYMRGAREDRLYWVLASAEGCFANGGWDNEALVHLMHWGSLLGFELEVRGKDGSSLSSTAGAIPHLTPTMQRRIESTVSLESGRGAFEPYPLFAGGEEIGTLLARPLTVRTELTAKEAHFRSQVKGFLLTSSMIAGGGALFLALVLSLFLTVPLRRLKAAAERVAEGDLATRVNYSSRDEVGMLTASFNHMVESLEREEALRKKLTSNIAHELRTPLAVMRSNIEAMMDGVVQADARGLLTLDEEVERLTRLVQGIEDVTKAEASFFRPLSIERMDTAEFLSGIAHGMRAMFEARGLTLSIQCPEDFHMEADPERTAVIIKNLISNALRYTERGGAVISAGVDGEGRTFIEVSDTGRGIPQDDLGLVFRRFHRGEGSTGFGLGLSIAREMAEGMGASLSVKSAPQEGSAFRLTLAQQT